MLNTLTSRTKKRTVDSILFNAPCSEATATRIGILTSPLRWQDFSIKQGALAS